MHSEILNEHQKELLGFIKKYKKNYYLVGGTALALQLGHRASIDFDLFTFKKNNHTQLKKDIVSIGYPSKIIAQLPDQIHFIVNNVKLTFFEFPFEIDAPLFFKDYCKMPNLITLAAMKAFALGGRAKWKDYVDLYFILKDNFSVEEISLHAKNIFKDAFNPILFLKQLSFFKDINYDEQVDFLNDFIVEDNTIKAFLTNLSLKGF